MSFALWRAIWATERIHCTSVSLLRGINASTSVRLSRITGIKHKDLSEDYIETGKTVQMGNTCQLFKQKPKEYRLKRVGSRFLTGLRSRLFGCKSNRRETSTI